MEGHPQQQLLMESAGARLWTKEAVVWGSQRRGGRRARVQNGNREGGAPLLLLSRALVRRGRRDVRQCFPLLIPLLHLSLPQIIPQPKHMLAARAYHIPMATARQPPAAYPQHRLRSLQTSTRTLPSMPNCFALQKPGEVSPLSIPHRHSPTRLRKPIMMEGMQGWMHKGELFFLLLPFTLLLFPSHFDGRRI